jgi:NitT/TauT family transport system substrate-binding protein
MNKLRIENLPAGVRVVGLALLWLGAISLLHGHLNFEKTSERVTLRMGYMPVVTNLAAPLLDHASKQSDLRFEAIKFPSFAEMAEAFRAGHIDVAFIIAPLAVAMHKQGIPLKVVYIGNRHESTLVVRNDGPIQKLDDLLGRTLAVPIRFSGRFLAIKRYFRENGYGDTAVNLVEIPPPGMPAALSAGSIDGYFVGEPFAAKSIHNGVARRLLDVESIWPRFICNLMVVRDELVRSHPDRVRRLVSAAVRSGLWVQTHQDEAIGLVAAYWGQNPEMVSYTFNTPPNRFRFDLPVPSVDEMRTIVSEMRKSGLLDEDYDVTKLIDDRFAREITIHDNPSVPDVMAICRQEPS